MRHLVTRPASTPLARFTRLNIALVLLLIGSSLTAASLSARQAPVEGDYLYRVTMLRAAPGEFNQLIEALDAQTILAAEAGDAAPFRIRHSQGDQWDFMLIYPMESRADYHSADRSARRARVWNSADGRRLTSRLEETTAWHEDWFATSAPLAEMTRRFDGMGLFHIEMFAGIPGKRAELLEQRRMENRYYTHLNRQLNVIFAHESGPNWDSMTIGFHLDLAAFAAGGSAHSAAQQEEAARAAGFESTSTIGPYLRSLLSYHRDTLGVPIG